MTMYCTLDDALRELGQATASATDDARLMIYIRNASARIDALTGWRFEPFKSTEHIGLGMTAINSAWRTIALPGYAVALNSVTAYNTALTISTTVRGFPANVTPFKNIQLVSTSSDWYRTYYDSSYDPFVIVNADWGYHDNYAQAWQAEDTVQDAAGINATVTTVTVADADGTNWRNETPRFSAGQLIKINSEWMRVTDTDTTAETLTVQRGVNGSTAAAHALDDAISVWYPVDDIRRVVARQAALLYKRRGAFEAPNQYGVGSGYPADLDADLLGVVQVYVNG